LHNRTKWLLRGRLFALPASRFPIPAAAGNVTFNADYIGGSASIVNGAEIARGLFRPASGSGDDGG